MPDPGADQQAEQRDHGRRVGQRVRPDPVAAAARGNAAGWPRRPGSRRGPSPGAEQRGDRRHDVGHGEQHADGSPRPAPSRRPPTATCGSRRWPRPSPRTSGTTRAGSRWPRRPRPDPLQGPGQRDVVEHLPGHGREAAGPRPAPAASTTMNCPLAATIEGRGRALRPAQRQRAPSTTRAAAAAAAGGPSPSASCRGHGDSRSQPGVPQQVDRGGHRVPAPAPRRRRRTPAPCPGPPRPAGHRRAACRAHRPAAPCRAAPRAAGRPRPPPARRPRCRRSTRRRGRGPPGPPPRSGPVPTGWSGAIRRASSRAGTSTDTALRDRRRLRAGAPASARRLTTWWTAAATANAAPARTTARPVRTGRVGPCAVMLPESDPRPPAGGCTANQIG